MFVDSILGIRISAIEHYDGLRDLILFIQWASEFLMR